MTINALHSIGAVFVRKYSQLHYKHGVDQALSNTNLTEDNVLLLTREMHSFFFQLQWFKCRRS